VGDGELPRAPEPGAVWTDPDFESGLRAFCPRRFRSRPWNAPRAQ